MKTCAPKFRRIALALLLASIPCGAVRANTDYYRQVIFDNSLTSDAYYYSHRMARATAHGDTFRMRPTKSMIAEPSH